MKLPRLRKRREATRAVAQTLLLGDFTPEQVAKLEAINERVKAAHPHAAQALWDDAAREGAEMLLKMARDIWARLHAPHGTLQ